MVLVPQECRQLPQQVATLVLRAQVHHGESDAVSFVFKQTVKQFSNSQIPCKLFLLTNQSCISISCVTLVLLIHVFFVEMYSNTAYTVSQISAVLFA